MTVPETAEIVLVTVATVQTDVIAEIAHVTAATVHVIVDTITIAVIIAAGAIIVPGPIIVPHGTTSRTAEIIRPTEAILA